MDDSSALEVFWATPRDPATLDTLLNPGDRAHLAWLRSEPARAESATARALLRGALATRLHALPPDIKITRRCRDCDRHHGRPLVDGLHVSASHTDDRVVVAITDVAMIGVDVEQVGAERFKAITFDDEFEQRTGQLDARARTRARAEESTRREAYFKAHGVGRTFDHEQAIAATAGIAIDVGSGYAATAYLLDDLRPPVTIIAADELLSAWAASPRTATA